MVMDFPRILLSGTSSRVGKTMISIGLMRALANRGYKVQPYKVGPDFIDPSFHYFATGRYSRNLDGFMMTRNNILEIFQRNFKDADIAVIEGKTGLYDSHDALNEKGSTAEVSKFLQCPTILIANAERLSRTAAAFVMGYKVFDPQVAIRGVVLNRVGGARHSNKARTAVEELAGMEVLGTVPRQDIKIPDRHLGLIPAFEREEEFKKLFDGLADVVERFVDVDKVIEIAREAPTLEEVPENSIFNPEEPPNQVQLGVFRDKTFNFYYQDNIDAFAASGASITYINSLKDKKLPEVDGLYIGGGFPEIFASELENNSSLREEVFSFCDDGNPVYAECGGLMYLGETLKLVNGEEYEMVGFLPIKTEMFHKFQALGYSIYEAMDHNIISAKGDTLLGHEFHYSKVHSTVHSIKELDFAFKVKRGKGVIGEHDGIVKNKTLANYLHIHVISYPQMIKRFVAEMQRCRNP
ncbi:MAG: cobyrinate a,c-diamide synthase [Archaeoglobaceae archaeon]